MTLQEMRDAAWKAAPVLRKRMVGRETFDELVDAAVANWDGDYMATVDRAKYAGELLGRVKVTHEKASGMTQQEYGFIWVFLLVTVASAVIQWLVKRWLDRNFDSDDVQRWKAEMAA